MGFNSVFKGLNSCDIEKRYTVPVEARHVSFIISGSKCGYFPKYD